MRTKIDAETNSECVAENIFHFGCPQRHSIFSYAHFPQALYQRLHRVLLKVRANAFRNIGRKRETAFKRDFILFILYFLSV